MSITTTNKFFPGILIAFVITMSLSSCSKEEVILEQKEPVVIERKDYPDEIIIGEQDGMIINYGYDVDGDRRADFGLDYDKYFKYDYPVTVYLWFSKTMGITKYTSTDSIYENSQILVTLDTITGIYDTSFSMPKNTTCQKLNTWDKFIATRTSSKLFLPDPGWKTSTQDDFSYGERIYLYHDNGSWITASCAIPMDRVCYIPFAKMTLSGNRLGWIKIIYYSPPNSRLVVLETAIQE